MNGKLEIIFIFFIFLSQYINIDRNETSVRRDSSSYTLKMLRKVSQILHRHTSLILIGSVSSPDLVLIISSFDCLSNNALKRVKKQQMGEFSQGVIFKCVQYQNGCTRIIFHKTIMTKQVNFENGLGCSHRMGWYYNQRG